MRLLVVEDEELLRLQLSRDLERAGYVVDAARDGREGLHYATECDYDAAVIDLGLPELDGVSLIRRIRERRRPFPVLILTARSGWDDKVTGLDAGADDYVAKPYNLQELLARLNALRRRAAGFAEPAIRLGPLVLDTRKKLLTRDGERIKLTSYEYMLLEHLMLHPGEVVSQMELTERMYAQDFERESNVIEVLVGRLRNKLDPDGVLKPIETVRGQGYRFALG